MIATAGIVLLGIGSLGVFGSCVYEWRYHAKIGEIGMKVFPWVFGAGGILLGVALATGG